MRVWNECVRLGMDTNSSRAGIDCVLGFIRAATPQADAPEREPERRVRVERLQTCAGCSDLIHSGERALRVGSEPRYFGQQCGCMEKREAARPAGSQEPQAAAPERAVQPTQAEPSGAEAVVREALDAIKKAHTSTLCCSVGPHAHSVYGVPLAGQQEAGEDTARMRKALDTIWEIATMADESDPAFSAMGALETIADIASDFEDADAARALHPERAAAQTTTEEANGE